MELKLDLDFDEMFEQEVNIYPAGGRIHSWITIKKKKAKALGLQGKELLRVAIQKNGRLSVFERRVQKLEMKTGITFRINIPKDTVQLLNLKHGDTVKVYIKRL